MTLVALSNQKLPLSYHAIQSADYSVSVPSHFKWNRTIVRCNLHLRQQRQRFHLVQLLTLHRKNMKLKNLAFAIRNDNDHQAEQGSSYPYTDDHNKILALEDNNEDFVCSEAESVSCSDAGLSEDDENVSYRSNIVDKVKAVQLHILASEQWNASQLKLCHRKYLVSATNLIHYLALRCLDIGQLKEDISLIGLLNLDTINSHVLASITACIKLLENLKSNSMELREITSGANFNQKILGEQKNGKLAINAMKKKAFSILGEQKNGKLAIDAMKKKAFSNRDLLLGSIRDGRTNYIMVTVGEEGINSETLIPDLIKAGTSIIRINCAHGNPSIWSEIIKRVKESSQMLEQPCRILMDLAGPKLRTGKLKPGPSVMKISPHKNASGNVILPAQVWLSHKKAAPPAHLSLDAILFIDDQAFLTELEVGDTLRFCDARGKKRTLKISRKFHVFSGTGYVAECTRTAYVQSGTELHMKRKRGRLLVGKVADVPAQEPFIRLRVGDLLVISRSSSSEQHELSIPTNGAHRLTCSSGYLFDSVKPGEPIAFDDGKAWGVIQGTSISEIVVLITHASPKGTKLGSEKSINIPESNIQFEGLTSKDLMDLEFVAAHADMVGISFVRDICDIVVVRQELEKRKLHDLGIILKIETKSGSEKLPLMLLEAMKSSNPLGVMIARGDLAVECGWHKLADLQEEILSLCGAAHLPVVWATQVLESLVKSGVPTRSEITDAASGRRASCIMLNKGEHIVKAVSTLDKILHLNSKQMKPFYSLSTSNDQK